MSTATLTPPTGAAVVETRQPTPLSSPENIGGSVKIDTSVVPPPIQKPANVQQAGPQRPAHVPEKFWKDGKVDVDGVLKSYTELEKKLAAPAAATPTAAPTAAPASTATAAPTAAPETGQTAAPTATAPTGDALAKFTTEFESNGALSEASYAELQTTFNLPKAVVDGYIAGQMAIRESLANELIAGVGGPEKYTEMYSAAKAAWTPEQVKQFEADTKGTPERIKAAVERLATWHKTEFPPAAARMDGVADAGVTNDAFKSEAEVLDAIRDPRYSKSAAYRAEVDAKVAGMIAVRSRRK